MAFCGSMCGLHGEAFGLEWMVDQRSVMHLLQAGRASNLPLCSLLIQLLLGLVGVGEGRPAGGGAPAPPGP